MKNKIIFIGTMFLLTIIAMSGCLENQSTTTNTKTFDDINFNSDVLQLVDSNLDIKEENGEIYAVEVELYFKNILTQKINVTYLVDFCDKNDNVLYSKSFTMSYFPPGYTFSTPDIFKYDGENVVYFDHININIESYEFV